MKSIYIFIFLISFILSCSTLKRTKIPVNSFDKRDTSELVLQNWYHKDYRQDAIPGISLEKFYKQNKKKSRSTTVIVAVIDTQIDTEHEDLKGQMWINRKEIRNNGIDDDHNGYIDDINGWNFLGTLSGESLLWANFEHTRIVREWNSIFQGKEFAEISFQDRSKYKEYSRAFKKLENENIHYKNWLKTVSQIATIYPLIEDTLKHFFPKEDYTLKKLDSVYKKYKINDKAYKQRLVDNDMDLGALIDYMMSMLEVNLKSLSEIKDAETQLDSIVNKNLNLYFDERTRLGDNPKTLEKGYGNKNISITKVGQIPVQDHATKVSGIIAGNRENNIGIRGIAQKVKIMPLNISTSGDEHDKDIALAIRYAVDNGAKVINMSFGKEFSLHKEWVFEAFQYAERHNVLLVHGAGNNNFNIDENPFYPIDVAYDGTDEVSTNFINVGSISPKLDTTFVSTFSNYGKQNVDLFAPGDKIYSTSVGNTYKSDSGTSLAGPMVAGAAALIWSYHPKLTATEVKQIILDSGTAYDIDVLIPGEEGKTIKFSELSKSGKVLNVYDAMELAKKVSKNKLL